ncbi:hypothetical protein BGZ96_007798 [Linnemannia gamsii]|uniref:Uncharacterized protein n=1 Tax=Linnemannia gamsii TaxID=64522 RepID=A0ABQ7JZN1_9FUNG|nr:hypothetical protein BGZ96_007798 [Linnemannia gamsii]
MTPKETVTHGFISYEGGCEDNQNVGFQIEDAISDSGDSVAVDSDVEDPLAEAFDIAEDERFARDSKARPVFYLKANFF